MFDFMILTNSLGSAIASHGSEVLLSYLTAN